MNDSESTVRSAPAPPEEEMAGRIRAFDWSKTALGPSENWSPALQTMVRIMLANRFPHILWWGPSYVQFYNDAYRPILGTKHPEKALGRTVKECWSEIFHVIGPLIDRPFKGGPATWDDDICLEVRRHDFTEETHFTIAYSPVPDETAAGGIGGVLATVHEISGKVIGDRRVMALRDLAARSAEVKTAREACGIAAQTLAEYPKDFPFVLLYLIDPGRKLAHLAGVAGVNRDDGLSPATVALEESEGPAPPWPFKQALRAKTTQVLTGLARRFGSRVPKGPWADAPDSAAIVPIRSTKAHELAGFLVAGISARLRLDNQYRDFLGLVASQIASAIAMARAYEEEKKRAEALAELDRAKTAFFSNISHEFRTPLTLIIGPMEDLISRDLAGLRPEVKSKIELAHRNSLRLLRLVNTLLDFSRIEAGRVRAVFEPTELAPFTRELASVFRAATDRAGLSLIVDCPPLREPVFVDREMWEKIVMNLISNAFKFTFEGEIEVTLRETEKSAELRVRDTGVGIPAEEMPRVFDRFYRIENTRSRTHEGTGIGLALVQELVKLHGGSVRAESQVGQGSTFIVSVPFGKDHLPAEQLGRRHPASASANTEPFIKEALRWLPEDKAPVRGAEPERPGELLPALWASETKQGRPQVLVADDNADMRGYLARLLGERYDVRAVADGRAALAAASERRPDLVLADVMMPHLDGMGLVRALRHDPVLKTIPIMLLSARADEEASVEALQAGADDYLIKPFSARELMTRVGARLEMARMRQETQAVLAQSKEELERVVTDRTANLRELVAELEHFSYTITHDMRAPLRAMRGFAEVIAELTPEQARTEQKTYLRRIITAAERMDVLITDALNFSKAVRQELPLGPVDVGRLVRGMLDSYPEFQSSRAEISVAPEIPRVMGNEAALTQCFSNLLDNSVKFAKPGRPAKVRVWGEARGETVRLFVEDDGVGLSEAMQARAFDMFSRGSNTQAGTGIGLALVRKVVNRMGGKVGVESRLGEGSRFWIELKAGQKRSEP